jgi:hypothetical protein
MKPQAILITQPMIDWTTFLSSCSDLLGRPVTANQDKMKVFKESPHAFVRCVGELVDTNANPYHSSKNLHLQRHISYTFLIASDKDTLFEFIGKSTTGLSVDYTLTATSGVYLSVASGNMQEWVNTCLACCTGSESFNLRFLLDCVILIFEKLGFGPLFANYHKESMVDQSFKLLKKYE